MKQLLRITGMAAILVAVLIPEVVLAQHGRMHRATRRRTAVVVSQATHAKDEQAAAAQPQQATAQEQSATAQQQSATAQQSAAAPALAVGTVATTLPSGCASKPVGGVEYYECGKNFYRAAFQGNSLVYVTTTPPPQ